MRTPLVHLAPVTAIIGGTMTRLERAEGLLFHDKADGHWYILQSKMRGSSSEKSREAAAYYGYWYTWVLPTDVKYFEDTHKGGCADKSDTQDLEFLGGFNE